MFILLQMLNPDSVCKSGSQEIERIYNSPEVLNYANSVKVSSVYIFGIFIRVFVLEHSQVRPG